MKTYVTFGQAHKHTIGDLVLDKDCVAVVNGDVDRVFSLFGPQFCFWYPERHWEEEKLRWFPRGYVEVPDVKL